MEQLIVLYILLVHGVEATHADPQLGLESSKDSKYYCSQRMMAHKLTMPI